MRKLILIVIALVALATNLAAGADQGSPATAPVPSASDASAPKAFVGIGVQVLTDAIRTSLSFTQLGGVLVGQVVPGAPGDIAGVRAGDIVTGVNGVAVASPTDFVAKIGALSVGSAAVLTLWSGGAQRVATATLVARPASLASSSAPPNASSLPPELQAVPGPMPGDPIVILFQWTPTRKGMAEMPLGLTFQNVSAKNATIVKFLIELADPFGKILETDAYEARGNFAPGAKIEPRKNGSSLDVSGASSNDVKDVAIGSGNAWTFYNRFGLEFDTWLARVVAVRFDDGTIWKSTANYPIVNRPAPPQVIVQPGGDDCGGGILGFLFC